MARDSSPAKGDNPQWRLTNPDRRLTSGPKKELRSGIVSGFVRQRGGGGEMVGEIERERERRAVWREGGRERGRWRGGGQYEILYLRE